MSAVTITESVHQLTPNTKLPGRVRGLLFLRNQGLLVLWLAIVVVFAFWGGPHFFTLPTGISVLDSAAIASIYAAGVAVGVMTGVLDLSVPGTAALAGVIVALLVQAGIPVAVAVLLALVAGVAVGVVNALVVMRGFDPLITTIAMLTMLSGIALLLAHDYNIAGLTQLTFMGTQNYLYVPAPVYIALILFVLLTLFLRLTRPGVRLLAVGGNAEAARRVGINVNVYRVAGFAISGFCAALGGVVTAAYISTAVPSANVQIVFSAMTAVALAGVPFTGGRGSLPRVALGAIVVATISAGLLLAQVPSDWSSVVTGLLLVGGLGMNMWTTRMSSKLLLQGPSSGPGPQPPGSAPGSTSAPGAAPDSASASGSTTSVPGSTPGSAPASAPGSTSAPGAAPTLGEAQTRTSAAPALMPVPAQPLPFSDGSDESGESAKARVQVTR